MLLINILPWAPSSSAPWVYPSLSLPQTASQRYGPGEKIILKEKIKYIFIREGYRNITNTF